MPCYLPTPIQRKGTTIFGVRLPALRTVRQVSALSQIWDSGPDTRPDCPPPRLPGRTAGGTVPGPRPPVPLTPHTVHHPSPAGPGHASNGPRHPSGRAGCQLRPAPARRGASPWPHLIGAIHLQAGQQLAPVLPVGCSIHTGDRSTGARTLLRVCAAPRTRCMVTARVVRRTPPRVTRAALPCVRGRAHSAVRTSWHRS